MFFVTAKVIYWLGLHWMACCCFVEFHSLNAEAEYIMHLVVFLFLWEYQVQWVFPCILKLYKVGIFNFPQKHWGIFLHVYVKHKIEYFIAHFVANQIIINGVILVPQYHGSSFWHLMFFYFCRMMYFYSHQMPCLTIQPTQSTSGR